MRNTMKIKPFEPKFMKVGILTAALQELTPREVRDPDPDRAIEDWLAFATFEDGYRANCVVEGILESARQGGVWTKINY